VTETLKLTVSNYAAVTGKRLFILPDIMTRSDRKLTEDNKRKFIIDLHDEFIDLDTTEIVVPQGYHAEVLPADIMIDNAFGKYECSVKFIDNQLFFTRRFEMRSGRFPATDFNGLVQFFAAVYKSDRSAVVLVKEE
jgi:hypothetical protein